MRRLAVFSLLFLAACASGPDFVQTPTLEANPNPAVPQAAVLRFTSDQPVKTSIFSRVGTSTRLREYTRTTPAEVVWEMTLTDPNSQSPIDWGLLFSEFLPSLNPAVLD